jgi:hypothetical protein
LLLILLVCTVVSTYLLLQKLWFNK